MESVVEDAQATQAEAPTHQAYSELQQAYEYFNQELFERRLPACLITLQRQANSYGYFSANQFLNRADGAQTHEIALNPSYFIVRTIEQTLCVLVTEMVSLDQLLHTKRDKLPRRRYRNTEWADMCQAIGLMPSDTGEPGGKRTGDNVPTYIIAGGLFDQACERLLADEAFTLSWVDRFPPAAPPRPAPAEDEADDKTPEAALADPAPTDQDIRHETAEALLGGTPPLIAGEGSQTEQRSDSELLDLAGNDDQGALGLPEIRKPPPPPMKRVEPVREESLKELGIEIRETPKNDSKQTFRCPLCSNNAWGKPSMRLGCYGTESEPHEVIKMILVASSPKKRK